jgi:hypothetical protein
LTFFAKPPVLVFFLQTDRVSRGGTYPD